MVLLLIDATEGVTDQDAHIAGYILESGRAVVLAINKWDAVDEYQRQLLERSIESRLSFLKFAPMHFISAQKRQGLEPLWKSIVQAHKSATCKMPTPVLTRLLMEAVQFQTPKKAGMNRPKMRYAHQGGMNPPVIVIHGNALDKIQDSYRRYLEHVFREVFKLQGTPLRIQFNVSENPFADRKKPEQNRRGPKKVEEKPNPKPRVKASTTQKTESSSSSKARPKARPNAGTVAKPNARPRAKSST